MPTLIVLVLGDMQIHSLELNLVQFHTTVLSLPLILWDKWVNILTTANSFNTCTVIANYDASTQISSVSWKCINLNFRLMFCSFILSISYTCISTI